METALNGAPLRAWDQQIPSILHIPGALRFPLKTQASPQLPESSISFSQPSLLGTSLLLPTPCVKSNRWHSHQHAREFPPLPSLPTVLPDFIQLCANLIPVFRSGFLYLCVGCFLGSQHSLPPFWPQPLLLSLQRGLRNISGKCSSHVSLTRGILAGHLLASRLEQFEKGAPLYLFISELPVPNKGSICWANVESLCLSASRW